MVHVPPGQIRVDVLPRLALQRRVAVEVPQHRLRSEHALEDRAGELVGEDVLGRVSRGSSSGKGFWARQSGVRCESLTSNMVSGRIGGT